jgi:excisionase family DNA binding protein
VLNIPKHITKMSRLLKIGEAAEVLGVSVSTLRRWDSEGRVRSDERTAGGQRRYDLGKLRPEQSRDEKASRKTWPMPACRATIKSTIWNGKSRCWKCIAHGRAGHSRLSAILAQG